MSEEKIDGGIVLSATCLVVMLILAVTALGIVVQIKDSMNRIEKQIVPSSSDSNYSSAYVMRVVDKLMDSGEAGKITMRVDSLEIPLDSTANFVRQCKNVTTQTKVVDSKWAYTDSPIASITVTDPKNPYRTAEYMPSYFTTKDVVEEVCETIMTNASIHLNGETNAIKFKGVIEIEYGKTSPNQTMVRVEVI
jgi:hypothetical protein